MDINGIKNFLGEDWERIVSKIKTSLASDISMLDQVNGVILDSSGKQMRPALALLMARACNHGLSTEATIRYAAATELLHNATLLHDDVADKSDCRRGKPTINSLMGPSVSVLVGDYWLVKAMDQILKDGGARDHGALRIFSKTLSDLAEGEMLQLQKAQTCDTVESDYYRIIYSKTGSLFEAAIVSAAFSVEAKEEVVEAARKYAVALGYAFQIKDDILDYDGTASVGKPLGVDIEEQKITLPLLGAFRQVSKAEEEAIRAKIRNIGSEDCREEIIRFAKENGGLKYAAQELDRFVEEAVHALDVLPDSQEKDYLVDMAHYTALREK